MFSRPEHALELPPGYFDVMRTYPLDRRQLSPDAFEAWMADFVRALDQTFCWLMRLEAFPTKADPTIVDLDFAFQTYHTFFALLVPLYTIIMSQSAAASKNALFDSLDLLSSFVTVHSGGRQAEEWCRFASRSTADRYVLPALGQYAAPVGGDLQEVLRDICERNVTMIGQGFIYPRDVRARLDLGYDAEEFQPQLLRQLRNAKHGFAIKQWDILDVHTGDFANEFAEYALLLVLAFLKDKSPFILSRL